jgi:hypothetical protein
MIRHITYEGTIGKPTDFASQDLYRGMRVVPAATSVNIGVMPRIDSKNTSSRGKAT